jgi:hypothetical protein
MKGMMKAVMNLVKADKKGGGGKAGLDTSI